MNDEIVLMSADVKGVVFNLKKDVAGAFRWYWPDGRKTDLFGMTIEEAQRTFAYRAPALLTEGDETK